jgi:hypothetical protein
MTKLTTTALAAILLAGSFVAANANGTAKKHYHAKKQACCDTGDMKKQVAELMQRIDELERRPNLTEKEVANDGNGNVLKITGQVNRAVLWHDNGKKSNTTHVDNANSPTRLNIAATGKWNDETTVMGEMELYVESNSSAKTSVHDMGGDDISINIAQVGVENKRFGNIHGGKLTMASGDSITENDHSGTTVLAEGGLAGQLAGGSRFQKKSTASFPDNVTVATGVNNNGLGNASNNGAVNVSAVFDQANGAGERNAIKYTTPTYWGFNLSTSHGYDTEGVANGGNDLWDVALRYGGDFNGYKVSATVAYYENHTTPVLSGGNANVHTGFDQVSGSIGMSTPFGFNLFFSGSHRDWDRARAHDAHHWHIKPGYQHKFFECGLTNFAVDYGRYENFVFDTTSDVRIKDKYKGRTWGVFLVQNFDRIATDVYLGYRNYELKIKGNPAVKAKDIDAVMFGMRIKF